VSLLKVVKDYFYYIVYGKDTELSSKLSMKYGVLEYEIWDSLRSRIQIILFYLAFGVIMEDRIL